MKIQINVIDDKKYFVFKTILYPDTFDNCSAAL